MSQLPQFVLALAVILAAAWVVGRCFQLLGQPPVMGEVVGGVLLGPSCLGWVAPRLSAYLFPAALVGWLGVYAQIGIVLYMFIVGADVDLRAVRAQGRVVFTVAQSGIWVPFACGVALAFAARDPLAVKGVPQLPFALFLGLALAVTAFPVLARLLRDARVDRSKVGRIALAAAAIGDVTAWCLLAVVVGVAQGSPRDGLRMLAMAVGLLAFLWLGAAPAAAWVLSRWLRRGWTAAGRSVLVLVLAAAAWAADAVGLHALFGAFVFGAALSRSGIDAETLTGRLERPVSVFLLPAFFAVSGLRTEIGLLADVQSWLLCIGVIAVACVGKITGVLAGGRGAGLDWRESVALAALMNTRGLVGLIILNIGLDIGLISSALFTMLVLMDLVTTIATGPLIGVFVRDPSWGLWSEYE